MPFILWLTVYKSQYVSVADDHLSCLGFSVSRSAYLRSGICDMYTASQKNFTAAFCKCSMHLTKVRQEMSVGTDYRVLVCEDLLRVNVNNRSVYKELLVLAEHTLYELTGKLQCF